MRLLQRRLRISWCGLTVALFFTFLSTLSVLTGEIVMPSKRPRGAPITRQERPADYRFFLGVQLTAAALGALFTRYEFRRGGWFNPH